MLAAQNVFKVEGFTLCHDSKYNEWLSNTNGGRFMFLYG